MTGRRRKAHAFRYATSTDRRGRLPRAAVSLIPRPAGAVVRTVRPRGGNFPWTFLCPSLFFPSMAQPEKKGVTPVSILVDLVLVVAFFLYIYSVVSPHVPTNDKTMTLVWGGLCAACMSGVFWLCIQMFRVVLAAQRADRRR